MKVMTAVSLALLVCVASVKLDEMPKPDIGPRPTALHDLERR
jgi:hypothetical protein